MFCRVYLEMLNATKGNMLHGLRSWLLRSEKEIYISIKKEARFNSLLNELDFYKF